MDVTVKGCLDNPLLEVMNFLNEVILQYPGAVSFAPGRPSEHCFDVPESLAKVQTYVDYRASTSGLDPRAIWSDLGQYNKTNGLINDLIARQLANDEGIQADPRSLMVTCGCQEGMVILLVGLFNPATDSLLVTDPSYIGIPGFARMLEIPLVPISTGEQGLDPADLARTIEDVRRSGRRPRALYDVPDFNNPLGTRMPLDARREVLDIAYENDLLIFEDNPYGMFSYDGPSLPSLKSLDDRGVVIYFGSFSKTLFPGLRVGYLLMDQHARLTDGRRVPLAAELSKIKSLTTITTPPLNQAIVGGILLENGCSLQPMMEDKLPFYRRNRDQMLASLDRWCGGFAGVEWNRPAGGFFLTLRLPFEMDEAEVQACARDYGVIICPMSFFALSPGREREVRLAFSYTTPDQIEEGVRRFSRYVGARIAAEQEAESGAGREAEEGTGDRVRGYSEPLPAASAEGAAR